MFLSHPTTTATPMAADVSTNLSLLLLIQQHLFGWYLWTWIMPFQVNIYSNLAPDQAIQLW